MSGFVDAETTIQSEKFSNLKLSLLRCHEHVRNNNPITAQLNITRALLKAGVTADEEILQLAIDFPVTLQDVLNANQAFYEQKGEEGSALRKAIKGMSTANSAIGFVELMLSSGADIVIKNLIKKDPEFLKSYTNAAGETALHSATKLGNVRVVGELIEKRYSADFFA